MDLLAVRSLLPGYLELLDPLLHFAHFGQQPAKNTVGRKELRIRLDRTLRIRNSFFEFAALLILQGNGDQSLRMFRVQFQLFLKLAQAPIRIARQQERSVEIVDVGRLRVAGQQLCEVLLRVRGPAPDCRADSPPGPIDEVLVAGPQIFRQDGPAQPGQPRGLEHGGAGHQGGHVTLVVASPQELLQHLQRGFVLLESREQQHRVIQYHSPNLRVFAQTYTASLIDVVQRPLIFLRLILAEAQQREPGTCLTVQGHQPPQGIPGFRILVLVVKQFAQEPPALRPRWAHFDCLAIQPDGVLDAVLPARLRGVLRHTVEPIAGGQQRQTSNQVDQGKWRAPQGGRISNGSSTMRRRTHGYGVSFTLSTRSPWTPFKVCTIPDGQWITTDAAVPSAPSPKCTGP